MVPSRSSRRSTRCLPMKPVAPVTKYFIAPPSTPLLVHPSPSPGARRILLQERRAAAYEVLVHRALDHLAHLFGDLEYQRAVLRRLGPVPGKVDRLTELDPPPRRQRDGAQQTERGERRGDREVGSADEPREQTRLPQLRVDLLGADDGDGHDRRSCTERYLHESSAAEALQPVTLGERLPRTFGALRKHHHEVPLLE